MRKVLPFIVGVTLLACKTEMDIDRANGDTFVRYFGSESSHTANLALETFTPGTEESTGYTLLSTVQTPTDNFGHFIYQVKLIHTDVYGNKLWEETYPEEFDQYEKTTENPDVNIPEGLVGGYRAASFIQTTDGGYLIVGDSINSNESTRLLLIKVNSTGSLELKKSFRYSNSSLSENQLAGISLQGKAVTEVSGSYLVLGHIANNSANADDMYVSKLPADFSNVNSSNSWTRSYGAGNGKVVNRLYYQNSNVLWGGSVTINNKSDFRIIQGPENAQQTNITNSIGSPLTDEEAWDFCSTSNSYAFVGAQKSGQDNDIFFARVSDSSDPKLLDSASYTFEEGDANNLNEEGNSISPGVDGGFAILATVESGSKGNGGHDYYLLKVNEFGDVQWSYNFGGSGDDEGASVRATSDGGYLLFGTSSFGNLKKLALIKVDAHGKL